MRIRRARTSDIATLVRQRRLMWEALGSWNDEEMKRADVEYERWTRIHMRKKDYLGWLVESSKGSVIGGGCLWLKPVQPKPGLTVQSQPYLLSMYTEPEYRGKGVATMIVQKALDWTRKNRFPSLALHASEMGREVYSRLGFKRTWEMSATLGPD